MKKLIFLICLTATFSANGKTINVASPNGLIVTTIETTGTLTLSVSYDNQQILAPSPIGLTLGDGTSIGASDKITSKSSYKKETIEAYLYRQSSFTTEYNQTTIALAKDRGLIVRAYNEGVAYRFYTKIKGETIILDETAQFSIGDEKAVWLSYSTNEENPFACAFQNYYDYCKLKEAKSIPAFLPATIDAGNVKITILEAELKSYPGMYLQRLNPGRLTAVFPRYPKTMDVYEHRYQSYVKETEDFICKSDGNRNYPWRILAITDDDRQMPVNNLVYALSEPSKITDTSWIKPGKVAWDWWNDWNLKGVDFIAGANTETYKYFIDFASKNGIEYVVLDEGWYDEDTGDIMNPKEDLNLPLLIEYGKQRNVNIVLWAVFNALDKHMDAFSKYSAMGIKGFKIDFMDRDDQTATEQAYKLAEEAAKYNMFVDYHGYYKPTGMSRTWPNILNYEGVFGMEEARWTSPDSDMPLYDVTFPYIRMMAGNVDFTPGALRNGTKYNWKAIYTAPVSMGTRCHQLACYVIHDAPFVMLCDAPTNYEDEQECTDIICSIPETFETTIIPLGEIGKYIVTARKSNDNWYIGGQSNWDSRDIQLSLNFLDEGTTYKATVVKDGVNAHHNAEDYKVETIEVTSSSILDIHMSEGGGFVIIIES